MVDRLGGQGEVKEWTTASLLSRSPSHPNALVVLNTPLPHHALFSAIWAAADVKYCADGGANRLFDALHSPGANTDQTTRDIFLPDLIKGDLDSLRPDVRAYFAAQGVPIVHDPDQNSTDLGKCIATLVDKEKKEEVEYQLIISGGLSGRLDQTAHTLHVLTVLAQTRISTWAVGRESIACVLAQGRHRLHVDSKYFGTTCAVLPFGQEARVTTKGQKWDLGPTAYAYPTSIAGFVSSSNQMVGDHVEIETDVPVVWTVEVKDS